MSELNFMNKVISVQSELKAPKNQYNSFGKYKYRSCEDVLEALKPLLNKYKLLQTIKDTVMIIGDRYYIQATVIVTDGNASTEVTALARESEVKKGMDDSQITGTASSYARKYALNGMWLIDDNEDVDAQDNTRVSKKVDKKSSANVTNKKITINDAKKLLKESKDLDELKSAWVKIYRSGLDEEAMTNLETLKNDRKDEIEDLTRELQNQMEQ
jgi:hypothetical protein